MSGEKDDEDFVHIKDWCCVYDVSPCCRTETIYLPSSRSEEPVASNMDISTGHIVLVSRDNSGRINICEYWMRPSDNAVVNTALGATHRLLCSLGQRRLHAGCCSRGMEPELSLTDGASSCVLPGTYAFQNLSMCRYIRSDCFVKKLCWLEFVFLSNYARLDFNIEMDMVTASVYLTKYSIFVSYLLTFL